MCGGLFIIRGAFFYYARKLSRYTRCNFLARPFPVIRGAFFIMCGGLFIIRGAFFIILTGPRSRSIWNEANYGWKSKWRPPLVFFSWFLGHLTELFHRDINTTDMICNQQGTGGHDEFAVTIMLHIRRAHRIRCTGIWYSEITTGRSFGRGLHNRGDFLYAFSQS